MALIQTIGSGGGEGRRVCGVMLEDGTEVRAKAVLSNATPKVTFLDLLPEVSQSFAINVIGWCVVVSSPTLCVVLLLQGTLPASLEEEVKAIDYTSSVTKINGITYSTYMHK